jgi:capsular exopolysaccharide synthesis family protein
MTTLPQTTSIRLPRPNQPGTLAMPAQVAGVHPSHAPQGFGMTGGDVWRVLRANAWLIIITLIVSIAAGVAINYFLAKKFPRFTAIGFIQIQPIRGYNPMLSEQPQLDTSALNIEGRTQAQLLKHDKLFTDVLTDPNSPIRETTWFKQFMVEAKQVSGGTKMVPDLTAAKEDLQDNFQVAPIADSKLMQVAMSYSVPKDCVTVMEALVNRHLINQRQINNDKQSNRTSDLTAAKQKLENKVAILKQTMRDQSMNLTRLGVSGNPGEISPKEMDLRASADKQWEIRTTYEAVKTKFESVKKQLDMGVDPQEIDTEVNNDPTVRSLQQSLAAEELALSKLSGQGLGQQNPTYKNQQAACDTVRRQIDQQMEKRRAELRVEYRESLQGQMESAKAQYDTITASIDKLKDELGEVNLTRMDYLRNKDELMYDQEQLKAVSEKLDEIATYNNRADLAAIDWAQHPEPPDSRSFPRLPITVAVTVAFGLALSLGIAFTRELADTTVRSPRDIQRVGQMNLLGMIPHEDDDPEVEDIPLPLVIFRAPTSIIAEQFRQVRTRLQHAASLDTTRSILVTSPGPQDGKTTVAANLAAGLALNGRRILLVDANFRRPELHKLFTAGNDMGFSNCLSDIENFEGAVHQSPVPNLDVMTTGPRPTNPTELMESQLLIDFIERALEEYDHVIFDSGPMLLVSETVALAPRVDGVISVVRARSNSRGLLQRMRDQLRMLKAEHLGVVLNGVRSQGGGYYGRNIKTYYEYQDTPAPVVANSATPDPTTVEPSNGDAEA